MVRVDGQHPAYVIYTSGSTGRPKGVVITQRGLVNHLLRSVEAYWAAGQGGSPTVLSTSFDGAVTALYAPLLAGQALTLLPAGEEIQVLGGGRSLADAYAVVKMTPSHLKLLNQALDAEGAVCSTRALMLGGEAMLAQDVAPWQQRLPGVRIINQYGPTETSVGCCTFETCEPLAADRRVPIGRPIWNTQVYVLDAALQPVPVGVPGELYVAGLGSGARLPVATGPDRRALRRPSLRAARVPACTAPATGCAGWPMASSITSGASTTRSRCVASGSSWARSRRCCASTPGVAQAVAVVRTRAGRSPATGRLRGGRCRARARSAPSCAMRWACVCPSTWCPRRSWCSSACRSRPAASWT